MPSCNEIEEIITRFLEGESSDHDIDILHNWLHESVENRRYFDEINLAFQASITLNRFNQQRIDDGWRQLQGRILKGQGKSLQPLSVSNSICRNTYLIAASVTITLAVISYLLISSFDSIHTNQRTIISSSKASNTHIILPDSSDVWLNVNSTLEYTNEFGRDSRVVILKGEAYFDIKKNQAKPFIVQTEDMDVRVKGTRFNVEAGVNGKTTRTTLEEGKVDLYVRRNNQSYVMKPGDQITIETDRSEVMHKKVNPSYFTAWKENILVFDNASLEEIIGKLENRYRVSISADKSLLSERFTLTIEQESFDEVLVLIELSSSLKSKKKNGQIILYE
ncbi:MAG: FecR domain-containing protein [Chryseolinea sp.]